MFFEYCALKDTLKSIQRSLMIKVIVMSLMNGVDSEEIHWRSYIGKEHLMPSLIARLLHVKKMVIVLILKQLLELFLENYKHIVTNASKQ